jgi:DNA topoisomerase-1
MALKKTAAAKKTPARPDDDGAAEAGGSRRLVIVESPAKAKTINKILGAEYTVRATVGHVIDLPTKELGVDVKDNFTPIYVTIKGKEKVIKELSAAAAKASQVYLAPDPDREGEAIAWHISNVILKAKNPPEVYRVTFNEITERAVREAMKSPTQIDLNKVNAQQARRVLDRLVGYGLSPLLWRKIRKGLSAGRVQSVAVRLVVDREREIEGFNKEEYWSITAQFEGGTPPVFPARLFKLGGETVIERSPKGNKFLITSEAEALRIRDELEKAAYTLKNIEKKLKKRSPHPPFITSTLQQAASSKLRFPAKKTMSVAQRLYEGVEIGDKGSVGLITYMRTDSARLAPEAVAWARKYIGERFGQKYLPEKPPVYKAKASAQEAHEAVRPTYAEFDPQKIRKYLTSEQASLYELIWKRFMASQMAPAELEQTTFDIPDDKGAALFRATGTIIKFNGYLALYGDDLEEEAGGDDSLLPDLKENEKLRLMGLEPRQHFTQPPPRYSEATLVKTLEEKGVGRPSTYAAILSVIEDRKYVEKIEGRFKPSELGMVVNDLLVARFPELIDVAFTAKMESDLDRIEEGAVEWTTVMADFYPKFSQDLDAAKKSGGGAGLEDVQTDEKCDKCGSPMVIKWGRNGKFLSCSGYPGCKNAKPIPGSEGARQPQAEVPTGEKCEKCGSDMVIKIGRFGPFMACSNYPACKNIKSVPTGIKCPLDGGDIVERRSKRGIFYGCSNYPDCKFTAWNKPVNEKCPVCGASYMLKKTGRDGTTVVYCNAEGCGHKREESEAT